MNIVVTSGTGTVGSEVTKALVARGLRPRVMTRSAEKFAALPKGAEGVLGDFENPATLASAFKGADALFLLTPLSPVETELGLSAVEAAKAAGIGRIVYMSVVMPPGSEVIPHFRSKIPIEEAVQESGASYTILWPNNFYQNDRMFREAIMKYGIYPQPLGTKVGANRVDVRDIADAATNALLSSDHQGRLYPLNGPEPLTGPDIARVYSRHLGREIRYAGDDLDAWEKQARTMLPEWLAHDLRIMYQFFQKHGLPATQEDLELQRTVLGHEPRTFEAFVEEHAAAWKS